MIAHRAHDYRFLIQRWRRVARQAGWSLRRFAEADGYPIFYLRSRGARCQNAVYISAGIHGDEPGGTEGLIRWAESHAEQLSTRPFLIFPCLNPWGLIHNRRGDASGLDLNRAFHRDELPLISALKQIVAPWQFSLALMLHEDFDGQGIYLYEIQRRRSTGAGWGEALLAAAEPVLPVDPRSRIDGHRAHAGVIRRRFQATRFAKIGFPEAIWLYLNHADHAFTLETPSEFGLADRSRAQELLLSESLRRLSLPA